MEEKVGMYTTMSIASIGPSTLPQSHSIHTFLHPSSHNGFYTEPEVKKPMSMTRMGTQLLTEDINGAQPKPLHRARRNVDLTIFRGFNKRSDLICPERFSQTQRVVDPLNPAYKLPFSLPIEPYSPKFVRDSFNVEDIEGTKCRPVKERAVRDVLKLDDIDGTNTRWRPRHELARFNSPARDIMDVKDITTSNRAFKASSRSTNPLEPDYFIHGRNHKEKFTFKPSKETLRDTMFLQTRDINYPPVEEVVRRDYRRTNYIEDIEGAQADTIKHGVVSKRDTNPLLPTYQALDGGEYLDNPVTPLIPPSMTHQPTFRPSRPEVSALPPRHSTSSSIATMPVVKSGANVSSLALSSAGSGDSTTRSRQPSSRRSIELAVEIQSVRALN